MFNPLPHTHIHTTTQEMISDSVDRVWSLQYVVAGPICGSAGPLSSPPTSTSTSMPYTHGVLFRFGQESPMNAFFAHPRTRDMLASILSAGATSATTITFSSSVPSELEAIFRRGNEWDEGAELIAGLDLQPGSNDDDATEFLSLTQQLATSSAFGAVQASYGPGISVIHHNRVDNDTSTSTTTTTPTTSSAPPTTTSTAIVLLCRFQSKDQLQQFLECPPVAAMFEGDERSPLKVGWSVVIEIAPPENSNTSKSPRGSLT